MADRTVSDLPEERNFVTDAAQEGRETERGLAATHPEIADDYREARRTRADIVARFSRGSGLGEGSDEETTKELRQTIRKYRSVYERLVER